MKPKNRRVSRSTPAGGHVPVMLDEVLDVLNPQAGEIAVDCTLGLGGHARAIVNRVLPGGRFVGLDWDRTSAERSRSMLLEYGDSVSIHAANFAGLPRVLADARLQAADVIVADLGMSSVQVDDADRGFSYVRDGPLDMRMDRTRGRTAAEILATIPENDLAEALRELADEPFAAQIARALVAAREAGELSRTGQVAQVVGAVVRQPVFRQAGWRLKSGGRWQSNPAGRTFQALRMLVNRELPNLQELLRVLPQCLNPSGRVAIISFHSGEDRLVKNAFREGRTAGWYQAVSEEPIRASPHERVSNPRSRSAKLRWALRAP